MSGHRRGGASLKIQIRRRVSLGICCFEVPEISEDLLPERIVQFWSEPTSVEEPVIRLPNLRKISIAVTYTSFLIKRGELPNSLCSFISKYSNRTLDAAVASNQIYLI